MLPLGYHDLHLVSWNTLVVRDHLKRPPYGLSIFSTAPTEKGVWLIMETNDQKGRREVSLRQNVWSDVIQM